MAGRFADYLARSLRRPGRPARPDRRGHGRHHRRRLRRPRGRGPPPQGGIDDIRIIEKGGDFGGTWYWNRYPGAHATSSPTSTSPCSRRRRTSRRRSTPTPPRSSSIVAASPRISTCTPTPASPPRSPGSSGTPPGAGGRSAPIVATRCRLGSSSWGTARCTGPSLPGVPGIESFKGHTFHTSRWDYSYTGGDSNGRPHRPADKRVGIIGTGATAVQGVPHVADAAAELYVFQRTPSSIDVRGNRPTDPAWAAGLDAGLAEGTDGELHHPDLRRRSPNRTW